MSVYTDEALLLKTHSRESRRQKQRSGMSTSSSSSGESPSRRSEPTLNFNADNVTNVTIVMSGSDPLLTSGPDERDDAEDELHALEAGDVQKEVRQGATPADPEVPHFGVQESCDRGQ